MIRYDTQECVGEENKFPCLKPRSDERLIREKQTEVYEHVYLLCTLEMPREKGVISQNSLNQ